MVLLDLQVQSLYVKYDFFQDNLNLSLPNPDNSRPLPSSYCRERERDETTAVVHRRRSTTPRSEPPSTLEQQLGFTTTAHSPPLRLAGETSLCQHHLPSTNNFDSAPTTIRPTLTLIHLLRLADQPYLTIARPTSAIHPPSWSYLATDLSSISSTLPLILSPPSIHPQDDLICLPPISFATDHSPEQPSSRPDSLCRQLLEPPTPRNICLRSSSSSLSDQSATTRDDFTSYCSTPNINSNN